MHVSEHGLEATGRAIESFRSQDYPNRELVIVADQASAERLGESVKDDPRIRTIMSDVPLDQAAARDFGCAMTDAHLIALWEDNTWYAPWRLSYQVDALLESGTELSAGATAIIWDPGQGKSFTGRPDRVLGERYLLGATTCLTRRAWLSQPFRSRIPPENEKYEDPFTATFTYAAPDRAYHAPRDAHFAIVVAPWTWDAAPRATTYPPGTAEALLGTAAVAFSAGIAPEPAPEPAPAPSDTLSTVAHTRPVAALVSCIMPTFNRREFIVRALRNIDRQEYPEIELVVVDDGTEPIGDLLDGRQRTKYIRLDQRATIGHKRNVACTAATGDVIVQWDDDDWYGPQRITRQVSEILYGNVDVTGIGVNLMLDVRSMQVWSTREREATDPLFVPIESLAGGTLAFRKHLWQRVGGYPDASLGEDVGLLQRLVDSGARAIGISNQGSYVYVRHGRNSWRFDFAPADGPPGWRRGKPPPTMDADDLTFYASLLAAS